MVQMSARMPPKPVAARPGTVPPPRVVIGFDLEGKPLALPDCHPHRRFFAWPPPHPVGRWWENRSAGAWSAVAAVLRPTSPEHARSARFGSRPSRRQRSPRNTGLGEPFAPRASATEKGEGSNQRLRPTTGVQSDGRANPALRPRDRDRDWSRGCAGPPAGGNPELMLLSSSLFEILFEVRFPSSGSNSPSVPALTNRLRPSHQGDRWPGAVGLGSAIAGLVRGDRVIPRALPASLQPLLKAITHLLKLANANLAGFPRHTDPPAAETGAAAPGRNTGPRQRSGREAGPGPGWPPGRGC